jgi:excisionase family DNA binding protein
MTADSAAAFSDFIASVVEEAVQKALAGVEMGGPNRMALTVKEAAEELGIGQTKMRELLDRGEIPHWRDGAIVRIRRAALEEWLQAREQLGGKVRWQPASVDEVFGPRSQRGGRTERARYSGGQTGNDGSPR